MRVLDLFCGTKSIANVAKERGHEVWTLDNDAQFQPDILTNILLWQPSPDFPKIDIVWASPPCQCFSVASIGTHWKGGKCAYIPKTYKAELALAYILKTRQIIFDWLEPKLWFIENPRGVLRKLDVMKGLQRKTVTYCQYGDTRMKPTDIWTNTDIQLKPPCKNGDNCHISAPRGSKTGTQGLKNATERGKIPRELCLDIIKYCEEEVNGQN